MKQILSYKPNQFGWVSIVCFTLVSAFFGKSIIKQVFELFDYYDYDMFYVNLVLIPACLYGSYKFVEYNVTKNYL